MSREELVERFTLERVGASPAVFDFKKLDWLNGVYLRALAARRVRATARALPRASRATTGTRSSSAGRAARPGEDRDARRVPGLRRLPLPATSSPTRRSSTARVLERGRARARGSVEPFTAEAIEQALRGARRAARAEAARGVSADPRRGHRLEDLAGPVREHRAARPRADARADQARSAEAA